MRPGHPQNTARAWLCLHLCDMSSVEKTRLPPRMGCTPISEKMRESTSTENLRRLRASLSLAALGAVSALLYASAMPLSKWLGFEPLRLHLPLFGAVFALYLLALRQVWRDCASGALVLGVVLGFALVFRILQVWTPVYLSSDVYRYLWDGRVQLAGVSPLAGSRAISRRRRRSRIRSNGFCR